MRPPCLWDKGPPLRNDLTAKVYGGIHTLLCSGFEVVTSKEETHASLHNLPQKSGLSDHFAISVVIICSDMVYVSSYTLHLLNSPILDGLTLFVLKLK
jgi:hypothetical protein